MTLTVKPTKLWDSKNRKFINTPETTLLLEHSLETMHAWEILWSKPFLDDRKPKTHEETVSYVKCMLQNEPENVDIILLCLTKDDYQKIDAYINAPMTATTFRKMPETAHKKEIVTSELIYCWMSTYHIDYAYCSKWHLNTLLALIKVCSIKSQPPKKSSYQQKMAHHQQKVAASKRKYG